MNHMQSLTGGKTLTTALSSWLPKSVTLEKWLKAKNYISELKEDLGKNPKVKLSYKRLEKIRGFLCHLAMVYEILFPYLKGFHLSLAKHLPNRNEEGWKINELE